MDPITRRLVPIAGVLVFVVAGCAGKAATTTTTVPGTTAVTTSSPAPGTTGALALPSTTMPILVERDEPPNHVQLVDDSLPAEYLYRAFVQVPFGAAWGPDGNFYIADMGGRHVVRVAPDGTMDDVGVWRDPTVFVGDGPKDVAFDSDGTLYVSDHGHLYRVDEDGMPEEVAIGGSPSGGIAFGPSGDLYFGERHSGNIYRVLDGRTETVATGLANVDGLVFGRDGMLYIVRLGSDMIMRLDPDTGELTGFFDEADLGGWDLAYLAVDADGDIWIRGKGVLYQVSPTGEIKPLTVDGVRNEYFDFRDSTLTAGLTLAGGLDFDDEGGLWMTSFTGMVVYLAPQGDGPDESVFTSQVIAPGYGGSDLTVANDGTVFTHNFLTGELWRVGIDGTVETIWRAGTAGGDFVHLAVDPTSDLLYIATPEAEIATLNSEGEKTHVAWLRAFGLAVAGDGMLYAIDIEGADHDQARAIVRITGTDQVEVLTTELGGEPIAGQSLMIGPASDGLYVFSRTTGLLYLVDGAGQSTVVADAATATEEIPYFFASTRQGEAYLIGYGVYRVGETGTLTRIAGGTIGDPIAAGFSPDGSTMYLAEFGAIDMIPLP